MSRYVVLDFETYPVDGQSFLMEIGCVEVIDGQIGKSFSTLVRPVAQVSDFVLNLTGIQQVDLDNAPNFIDVIDDFYSFIANSVVVAHNSRLDCLSYESFCRYFQFEPKNFLWVDSQDIIKLMDPSVNTLQLQSLLKIYNFSTDVQHRALDDAIGLARLLQFYTKERSLSITKQEISFLKESVLSSVKILIKFLLQHFDVVLNDDFPVADRGIFNSVNDDVVRPINFSVTHYNLDQADMVDFIHEDLEGKSVIFITSKRTFLNYDYYSSPDNYVFPDKVSRLYPILVDVKTSHIEMVELVSIINWLRQTTSFQINELNDQLVQRYQQLVSGVLDTHPIAVTNFVKDSISETFASSSIIELDYHMFLHMIRFSPDIFSGVFVYFVNFFTVNHALSSYNSTELSFTFFKSISKSIVNLSFIIDYLNYLDIDSLKFVKDFARIKSYVHLIEDEKIALFQKLNDLVQVLSVNIYDYETRQILINHNIYETTEWQEITGILTVIIHYIDEILKLFQRVSFYIYSDLTNWFSDLIYLFTLIKKDCQKFLQIKDGCVLYIEASVKNKPSNCRLILRGLYEHNNYNLLLQYAAEVGVHQPVRNFDVGSSYFLQLLGFKSIKLFSKDYNYVDVNIMSKSVQSMCDWIDVASTDEPFLLLFNSKRKIRFWKSKLRHQFVPKVPHSEFKYFFKELSEIDSLDKTKRYNVIFPEFSLPNLLQPIHFSRLNDKFLDENDYLRSLFCESLNIAIDHLNAFDISSITINVDSEFEFLLNPK